MTLKTQRQGLCLSWNKKWCSLFVFWLITLSICSAQSISELEYFFGADPGFGNGTMISANTNSGNLTQSLSLPLTGLEEGFQQLTIRVLDDQNQWSLYQRIAFYISEEPGSQDPAANIAGAEYWFDTDPGLGNANSLTISGTPSETTENFAIPLGSLDVGFHSIGIRTQNTDGIWSLYDNRIFYIFEETSNDPISNIAGAEYWFDTDPGFGSGTPLTISGSPQQATESYVIPLGSLEPGFHNLGIRVQNLDGTWSLYDKRVFYILDTEEFNVAPITEMEFLYDAELGFGTGETVPVTATGNPNEYLVEIPTDMVTCDLHDLWVSLKNEDGGYSLYNILVDVDVFDNANPTIVVFDDITVELDSNGLGAITIDDVNNGTFDDCELASVVMSPETANYDCDDLGIQTVTVTATDAEDKVSTLEVDINIVDNIDPVAIAQNIIVQLDSNGEATITANQLENGSTDNCSIASRSVNITSFNCDDLGDNTVNFTVTDTFGNTNTVQAVVTVQDTENPTAIAQNITLQLDANGLANIVASDINQSTDNCSIVSSNINISLFNCADLGENTVTLTVEDQSGNTANTTAVVTVVDEIDPVAVVQNITVQLDSNGEVSITKDDVENGSTDNCSIVNSSIDISSFTCDDLGDNDVILTVTDTSGNIGTATAVVTVEDNIDPIVQAQNITAALGNDGTITIDPFDLDNGSSDNCTLDLELDIATFDCDDLGNNTVTLTAIDQSGNSVSTSATVTIVDTSDPVAAVSNITVQLNQNGEATISINDIENGSSDNCAITGSSIDVSSFTCDDLGENDVILTVTDQSGNSDTATAIVTVIDNVDPELVTQNITVQLDNTGSITVDPFDLDNGSSDNCLLDLELNLSTFTCDDLGDNTVSITAVDDSGNAVSANAIITVVDVINPTAIGQDITVDLAGQPSITISASDVNNGSNDNCTFNLSIDQDTFTNPGDYPVVLTVTDSSGNSDSTTVTVTVTDSTLGIEELEINSISLRLYPNPVNSILNYITNATIDQISIFDISGKRVMQVTNPSDKIDVSQFGAGMYFIKFESGNANVIKRFIKN
ncbi:MAG: T9SS type A sorting domain-containing protein [bacterium]